MVHKCIYCSDIFVSLNALNAHNKTKCVDKYICNLCNTDCKNKQNYNSHINRKNPCIVYPNNKKDKLTCQVCNKNYSTLSNLYKHKNKCKLKNNKDKVLENINKQLQNDIKNMNRINKIQINTIKKYKENNDKYKKLLAENKIDYSSDSDDEIESESISKSTSSDDAKNVNNIKAKNVKIVNNVNNITINFNSDNYSRYEIEERFTRDRLNVIKNLLLEDKTDELREYMVEIMHFSKDYPEGHNLKFSHEENKCMVYNDSKWKPAEISKVRHILQKEASWGIKNTLDSANKLKKNKEIVETMQQNAESLDSDNYIKNPTAMIKKYQEKLEKA